MPNAPLVVIILLKMKHTAILESLLFVASGPVAGTRLAKALEIDEEALEELLGRYQLELIGRGLQLQRTEQGIQLTTIAEAARYIEPFLGLETVTRLSPAAVEVLAIIAYQQPITRPYIDHIRGVNSDGALRKLLTHGLIEEIGRQESAGRPILYGTSAEFLQQFGLTSLNQLPPLEEEALITLSPPRRAEQTEYTAA